MNNCELTRKVSAYYDGELPDEEARALQEHVESCRACQTELEHLRGLSVLLADRPLPVLSGSRLEGLHASLEEVKEEPMLQLARALTAAAAALLLICAGWAILGGPGEAPAVKPLEAWEKSAIALEIEPQTLAVADNPIPELFVEDFALGGSR